MPASQTILENASVLDVIGGRLVPGQRVVIAGDRIAQVAPSSGEPPPPGARVVDVGGRTVMPGLCDAHVHVTPWTANLTELMRTSVTYTAVRAVHILEEMLQRGF